MARKKDYSLLGVVGKLAGLTGSPYDKLTSTYSGAPQKTHHVNEYGDASHLGPDGTWHWDDPKAPPTQQCENCFYYGEDGLSGWGKCHRNPSTITTVSNGHICKFYNGTVPSEAPMPVVKTPSGQLVDLEDSGDHPVAPNAIEQTVLNSLPGDAARGLAMTLVQMGIDSDEAAAMVHATAKIFGIPLAKEDTPSTADCFREIIMKGHLEPVGLGTYELYKEPKAAHLTPSYRFFVGNYGATVKFQSAKNFSSGQWKTCAPHIADAINEAIGEKLDEQAYEEEDAAYEAQHDDEYDPYGELDSEKTTELKLPKLPLPTLNGEHMPDWADPVLRAMYQEMPSNWKRETGLTLGQCVTIANALIMLEDLPANYMLAYEDSNNPTYFFVGPSADMNTLDYTAEVLNDPLSMGKKWEREHAIEVASMILQRRVFAYNIESCHALWQKNALTPSIGTRTWWSELAVRDAVTVLAESPTTDYGGLLAPSNLEKHLSPQDHQKHITGNAPAFALKGAGLAGDIGSDIKHNIDAIHTSDVAPIPRRRSSRWSPDAWVRDRLNNKKLKEAEIVASGDNVVYACDEPVEAVDTIPSGPIMKIAEPEDFE